MNMWLVALIILLSALVIDSAIRTVLLLHLAKKIDAKADYRKRKIEIGSGSKHFVITLLGASSIYGEGSTVEVPFAGELAKRLAEQGYTVTVHNLAVSGHRIADVTHMQLPQMKPSDLAVVYAGTKDCLRLTPTKQYLADLKKLAKALQGQAVIWVTIGNPRLLWLFPVWLRWLFYARARTFTRLLKQVVVEDSQEHWLVADFFTEGLSKARNQGLTVRQIVSDGIHLSDEGQRLVGEMVDALATF